MNKRGGVEPRPELVFHRDRSLVDSRQPASSRALQKMTLRFATTDRAIAPRTRQGARRGNRLVRQEPVPNELEEIHRGCSDRTFQSAHAGQGNAREHEGRRPIEAGPMGWPRRFGFGAGLGRADGQVLLLAQNPSHHLDDVPSGASSWYPLFPYDQTYCTYKANAAMTWFQQPADDFGSLEDRMVPSWEPPIPFERSGPIQHLLVTEPYTSHRGTWPAHREPVRDRCPGGIGRDGNCLPGQ